jgi:hypothetical protein
VTPRLSPQRTVRPLAIAALCAAAFGCSSDSPLPTTPTAVDRSQPVFVSDSRGTFIPRRDTNPPTDSPVGTTFHVKVLTKIDVVTIHLAVCGVPCNTASFVRSWGPSTYGVGDEIVWTVSTAGRYYFFLRDPTIAFQNVTREERVGNHLRMTFETGTVLEAWFIEPA